MSNNLDLSKMLDSTKTFVFNAFVPAPFKYPAKVALWSVKRFGLINTLTGGVAISVATGVLGTAGAVYAGYKAYNLYTDWKESSNTEDSTV